MGCWSESCAFSGLEIASGDEAYVFHLAPDSNVRDGHPIVHPPARGHYDDYGGLELLEPLARYDLKVGDEWSPTDSIGNNFVFVHAGLFESLDDIPRDWSPSHPLIGGFADEMIEGVRKAIQRSNTLERQGEEIGKLFLKAGLSEAIGYNSGWMGCTDYLIDAVLRQEDIEEWMVAYRRCLVFKMAEFELRKRIAPRPTGPQHDGQKALLKFTSKVTEIASRRSETTNLKGCPFCGNEPSRSTRKDENIWDHSIVEYTDIDCTDCGFGFSWPTHHEEVEGEPYSVTQWQARVEPSNLSE